MTDLIQNAESNEKHEELDLDLVSKEESHKVFKSFDSEHTVQVESMYIFFYVFSKYIKPFFFSTIIFL